MSADDKDDLLGGDDDTEEDVANAAEPLSMMDALRKESERELREHEQSSMRLRSQAKVMTCYTMFSILFCVWGASLLKNADDAHTHDWKYTTCEIVAAWTGNALGAPSKDSATCAFFAVRPVGSSHTRAACAVLANFSDHALSSAPACSPDGSPVPEYALDWAAGTCWADGTCWNNDTRRRRAAPTPVVVECEVPRHESYVMEDRCHEAAVTSGTLAGFSRAHSDHMVYLIHDRDEASEATHQATAPQRNGGIVLLVFGSLFGLGATVCLTLAYARRGYRKTLDFIEAQRAERLRKAEQEFKTP